MPTGGAPQDVFTGGGVRVTFDCIGGDPGATAVSQVDDSVILVRNNAGSIGGVDFDAGQGLNLSSTVTGVDLISLEFATPGGAGVTASLRIDNSPTMGANNCLISGSVIAK